MLICYEEFIIKRQKKIIFKFSLALCRIITYNYGKENIMSENQNLILLKAESGKRKAESGLIISYFSIKVKKNHNIS